MAVYGSLWQFMAVYEWGFDYMLYRVRDQHVRVQLWGDLGGGRAMGQGLAMTAIESLRLTGFLTEQAPA